MLFAWELFCPNLVSSLVSPITLVSFRVEIHFRLVGAAQRRVGGNPPRIELGTCSTPSGADRAVLGSRQKLETGEWGTSFFDQVWDSPRRPMKSIAVAHSEWKVHRCSVNRFQATGLLASILGGRTTDLERDSWRLMMRSFAVFLARRDIPKVSRIYYL